jgi:hypothetical protein
MRRRRTIWRVLIPALCLVAILACAESASACPSCQRALGDDTSQGDLARGIYYSVLFMLSMPFAIVGTFGCMAYRAVKREHQRLADAQRASETSTSPSE